MKTEINQIGTRIRRITGKIPELSIVNQLDSGSGEPFLNPETKTDYASLMA
jgi:hypothetical protein